MVQNICARMCRIECQNVSVCFSKQISENVSKKKPPCLEQCNCHGLQFVRRNMCVCEDGSHSICQTMSDLNICQSQNKFQLFGCVFVITNVTTHVSLLFQNKPKTSVSAYSCERFRRCVFHFSFCHRFTSTKSHVTAL